ncbi:bacillithiol system redox-active protein YtxJ [Desulfosporosinus fructosivorans]|nr:bacillithiol system redox-active protein YtxJ [Desulfosporosinus fructosivorans]
MDEKKEVETMAVFKEITCSQELGQIMDESCGRQVIIFKHSTSCPISSRAWQEVQNFIKESSDEVSVCMIKVIESRPVSSQVTEELGVKHQSPQVLFVRDRQVLWHASHQEVTQAKLMKTLAGETLPVNLMD